MSDRERQVQSHLYGTEKKSNSETEQGVGNQAGAGGQVEWVKMVDRHTPPAVRHAILGVVCTASDGG